MRMWLPLAAMLMVVGSFGWEAAKQRLWPEPAARDALHGPVAVRLSHSAGFSVMRPVGFAVTHRAEGYVFVEEGDLRAPLSVAIGGGRVAVAPAHKVRDLPAGRLSYWLEQQDGGSGGPLWRLVGVIERTDGPLRVEAAQQREDGAPRFSRAWTIFESIRGP